MAKVTSAPSTTADLGKDMKMDPDASKINAFYISLCSTILSSNDDREFFFFFPPIINDTRNAIAIMIKNEL